MHKCSYCDFYSFTRYAESDFTALIDQMCRELREAQSCAGSRWGEFPPVSSIFFGGGTPSLLPPGQLERLITEARRLFVFDDAIEVTIEANPETVSKQFVEALSQTSFNRVSLGAQSFKDAHLKTLERLGSAASIQNAVHLLRGDRFENLNLDLIASIPGQSEAAFIDDIKKALALSPTHLSFYTLTLKPEHPLAGALPNTEVAADQYETGTAFLKDQGFWQYEISNFSLPGRLCRHNLLYWTGGDFLGIGPSAASRFFREGRFYHRKQKSHFQTYLKGSFEDVPFEATSSYQTVLEAVFLELRTNAGVDMEDFSRRYRYDVRQSRRYPDFTDAGFIETTGSRVRLSARGRLLADSITSELVDEALIGS